MAGRWRTGRKVGRTIYAQVGDEPSDGDHLIGVMDTPELAERVVTAVNNLPRHDFYEDDEPIEKIEEILSRPADGVTEPPNTGSKTVFMGPSPVGGGQWQPWVSTRPATF